MKLFKRIITCKEVEFELDTIGRYSESSFAQLTIKILMLKKGFTVKTEIIDAHTFLAIFESARTKLGLIYLLDGTFVSRKIEILKDN